MNKKNFMRIISLCLVLICSINAQAQKKLGDYIEINNTPAFVFYIDETGEHGLAMSMGAMESKDLKTFEKLKKKGKISEEEYNKSVNVPMIDKDAFKDAKILKSKDKEILFKDLISQLSDKGQENAIAIKEYCDKNNISMKEKFPWQYWASQLGEGWYIPGDYELELFAKFFCGGLGKKHGMGGVKFLKHSQTLSDDTRVQSACYLFTFFGLISSTAKHADCGFRVLKSVGTRIPSKTWLEIYDTVEGPHKEKTASVGAVHAF